MRLLVLLLALVLVASATSIRLERKDHRMYGNGELTGAERVALVGSGNTVPLGGGLLVLGTYVAPLTVGTPPITVDMLVCYHIPNWIFTREINNNRWNSMVD